ncbi:hypothetical protein NP233_g13113 [Leucocoprinus birnbaumii]|uniref:Uncharacterized protein n=1 Tax=Leucocoprinus birnbaumii TaxID=56174 RepID=A0AAD5VD64_9AGAR|nr:hypothetical protein NP233_g13113 [Leucocoprinus birnbaumii]
MKRAIFHMEDKDDVQTDEAHRRTDSYRVLFQGLGGSKRLRTMAFATAQQPSVISRLGIINHLGPPQPSLNKESNKSRHNDETEDEDSLAESNSENETNSKPTRRQVSIAFPYEYIKFLTSSVIRECPLRWPPSAPT